MSNFIKQKQIENLVSDLSNKANANQVLSIANNLSDLASNAIARTNLDVHSKAEINALISGATNALSVENNAAKSALTGLQVSDRIFVSDDGDAKWAMYIVTAVTDGLGSSSSFQKVADQDVFDNAMSAAAVKASYESNANTNAFTDAEKTKVGHISVTQAVNLDTMESGISTNTTNITTAQNTANSALTAANNAQNTANSKEDAFTETTEVFTGVTVEPNMDNVLNLANNIKAGFDVMVFFGALRVNDISWTAGNNEVTINVPYLTESADEIRVSYKY